MTEIWTKVRQAYQDRPPFYHDYWTAIRNASFMKLLKAPYVSKIDIFYQRKD